MEIHDVAAKPGVLGIGPMPGIRESVAEAAKALSEWGAGLVLSMSADGEMERNGVHGFEDHLALHDIHWRHMPIADFGAPKGKTAARWSEVSAEVHTILDAGGRVFVHCRAGCGRAGMTVLRLMVERGESPGGALKRLRAARPCAVETEAQFSWASEGAR